VSGTRAANFLTDSGQIYLEVGKGQAAQVVEILKYHGFVEIEIHKDFSEIERLVIAKRP
jgi:methylase of polypeptide subunit release factors